MPLGMLDIPSRQAQEEYEFNIVEASHTVIFASSGYGKSTILQTLVLGLSERYTPEQVVINLLDFGNNGLLPLSNLPNVADNTTFDDTEKLSKMLAIISNELNERRRLFKDHGVANLEQFEVQTETKLPVLCIVVDGYDALADDSRRDGVDAMLTQIIRDGAALGLYCVLAANQVSAVRANMLSGFATKLALHLNEESDLSDVIGRNRLPQSQTPGSGQLLYDGQATAIQFYLPTQGIDDNEILNNLHECVDHLASIWHGWVPKKIPMVPDELTNEIFEKLAAPSKRADWISLGLNKTSALVEGFDLFQGRSLGLYAASPRQSRAVTPLIVPQLFSAADNTDTILIDSSAVLGDYKQAVNLYIQPDQISQQPAAVKHALLGAGRDERKRLIVINGVAGLFDAIGFEAQDLTKLIEMTWQDDHRLQLVFIDSMAKVSAGYTELMRILRQSIEVSVFGGSLADQNFLEGIPFERRQTVFPNREMHVFDGEDIHEIIIPMDAQ